MDAISVRFVATLLCVASSVPTSATAAVIANEQTMSAAAAALVSGRDVYRRACASCHGRAGRGDGPAAAALNPRPRDFTAGKYKFRSTPSGMPPTDSDLFRVVTSGIPRTYMLAWEELLSERQRHDVVAYIKTFSDVFEADDDNAVVNVPPEPNRDVASVAEGSHLYIVMQCASCHGPAGRGDGAKAGTLQDDWGREIEAFDFTVGSYKRGSDGESIFRTFDTGLNGTPMPSYDGAFVFGGDAVDPARFRDVYPDDTVASLAAYLNEQPTSNELSSMSPEEIAKIESRRKWALVHYVQSLSRDTGFFHWLLVEDTEVVR